MPCFYFCLSLLQNDPSHSGESSKVLSRAKVGFEEGPSVCLDPHFLKSELYEQMHGFLSAHIPALQLFNWTGGGAWL